MEHVESVESTLFLMKLTESANLKSAFSVKLSSQMVLAKSVVHSLIQIPKPRLVLKTHAISSLIFLKSMVLAQLVPIIPDQISRTELASKTLATSPRTSKLMEPARLVPLTCIQMN